MGLKGYWLENLMKHIGSDHVVIADAKRGDIGTLVYIIRMVFLIILIAML